MRRLVLSVLLALLASILFAGTAVAGNPHFVRDATIVRDGNTLAVSGKIAGLGNEEQVEVEVTALAECINPGGNKPKAANKESFSAAGTFPVQNGKADYELTLTADLKPNCSPPMTLVWSDVVVTDLTHGIEQSYPGPF